MAGKGPAPSKSADQRRRNSPTPNFKQLPFEGRIGDAPIWPFGTPTLEQHKMWTRLWSLPQAVMWERMRCEDTVALYVLAYCHVVDHPTDDKMMNQVRQLDSKLGLSPRALLDLRWEIEQAPVEDDVVPTSNGAVRTYVPRGA